MSTNSHIKEEMEKLIADYDKAFKAFSSAMLNGNATDRGITQTELINTRDNLLKYWSDHRYCVRFAVWTGRSGAFGHPLQVVECYEFPESQITTTSSRLDRIEAALRRLDDVLPEDVRQNWVGIDG